MKAKINILNCPIDKITMEETINTINTSIQTKSSFAPCRGKCCKDGTYAKRSRTI